MAKLERGDGVKTVNSKTPTASKPKPQPKTAERTTAQGDISSDSPEHASVSIRPISNGFLVSESCSSPKGEYTHRETYHPKRPKITMPKAKASSNRMDRDGDRD